MIVYHWSFLYLKLGRELTLIILKRMLKRYDKKLAEGKDKRSTAVKVSRSTSIKTVYRELLIQIWGTGKPDDNQKNRKLSRD